MMRNVLLLGISLIVSISGHGRLLDPPYRSSVWRFREFADLQPPINYDDNQLFCGGADVQHGKNGGRCGECGDSWDLPRPRDNEHGGKYGRGIIVKNYTCGEIMQTDVEITASHMGQMTFSLCDAVTRETKECFDTYPLQMAEGGTTYPVGSNTGHYYPRVKLPEGVTCEHCVLQWTYTAGNNWGVCEDGTGRLGCGPQETFRGCADIGIYKPNE